MQYSVLEEVLELFPTGRYLVNSCQLEELLKHDACRGVSVRVLHVGTVMLDKGDLIERLNLDNHPRLDEIEITCLDGVVIIDNPDHGN